eukprot:961051_1
MKHGNKWANGIVPMIAGCTMLLVGDTEEHKLVGLLVLIIGVLIIIAFCAIERCTCSCAQSSYTISFNADECTVSAYTGRHRIYSTSYNEFKQLSFQLHRAILLFLFWRFFCEIWPWFILWWSSVHAISKWSANTDQSVLVYQRPKVWYKQPINILKPIHIACLMCNQKTENDESERIPVGSYCYVDCETVYGVVIGHLPDDQYS